MCGAAAEWRLCCHPSILRPRKKGASQKSMLNLSYRQANDGVRIVAPRVYNEAIGRMAELFAKVEADRGVIIPDAIRLFLSNTVIESLYLRHDAWRQTCDADPAIGEHAGRICEQIHDSLLQIINNADTEAWTANGALRVTFVGVLRCIHDRWCRIFPFCKTS